MIKFDDFGVCHDFQWNEELFLNIYQFGDLLIGVSYKRKRKPKVIQKFQFLDSLATNKV